MIETSFENWHAVQYEYGHLLVTDPIIKQKMVQINNIFLTVGAC